MINYLSNSEKIKKIESYFFSILLFELFLGGSGRVISFGFITLRMILFAIALFWFTLRIVIEPNDKFVYRAIFAFIILLLVGSYVGYRNNAPTGLIFTDVKQLLYFFSIICFSYLIKSKEKIDKVLKIIKISTLILAISYLICYVLIKINIIQMDALYNLLSAKWLHNEFMFRGTGGNFFYKGFFYLGIGIFFFLFNKPSIKNGIVALLIYIALFLTLLRWLLAIVLLIYSCSIFFMWAINKFKTSYLKSKEMIFHYILISIMIIIPITFKNFYITTLGDKRESVDIRKQQIDEVKSQIFNDVKSKSLHNQDSIKSNKPQKKFNFLVGKGFGIGVPIRPVHMELTYLEIFYKQGLIGILFWLLILIYCIKKFKIDIEDINLFYLKIPWIAGVLVIYLQSLTNPLLINSIGIGFILLAIFVLRTISKLKLN